MTPVQLHPPLPLGWAAALLGSAAVTFIATATATAIMADEMLHESLLLPTQFVPAVVFSLTVLLYRDALRALARMHPGATSLLDAERSVFTHLALASVVLGAGVGFYSGAVRSSYDGFHPEAAVALCLLVGWSLWTTLATRRVLSSFLAWLVAGLAYLVTWQPGVIYDVVLRGGALSLGVAPEHVLMTALLAVLAGVVAGAGHGLRRLLAHRRASRHPTASTPPSRAVLPWVVLTWTLAIAILGGMAGWYARLV